MCGIAGYLAPEGALSQDAAEAQAWAMIEPIERRGPDSWGVWAAPEAGVGFGHRRLAIIDLSPAGHQPMASHSGRYMLCFNGEIYNHEDLRAELRAGGHAPQWRGHSDTETLAAGFDAWGIEATIARAVGMFALAVWDSERRVLTLLRDRMGESRSISAGRETERRGPSCLVPNCRQSAPTPPSRTSSTAPRSCS